MSRSLQSLSIYHGKEPMKEHVLSWLSRDIFNPSDKVLYIDLLAHRGEVSTPMAALMKVASPSIIWKVQA